MARSKNTRSHHNIQLDNCGRGSGEKWSSSAYILLVEPSWFAEGPKVWWERTRPSYYQLWKPVTLLASSLQKVEICKLFDSMFSFLFNYQLQDCWPGNNTFKMLPNDCSAPIWRKLAQGSLELHERGCTFRQQIRSTLLCKVHGLVGSWMEINPTLIPLAEHRNTMKCPKWVELIMEGFLEKTNFEDFLRPPWGEDGVRLILKTMGCD